MTFTIPGLMPNNKLPLDKLPDPITITAPPWEGDSSSDGTRPGDYFYVFIGGDEVTEVEYRVPDPVPTELRIDVPKSAFAARGIADREVDFYTVLLMYADPGGEQFTYRDILTVIDLKKPGGDLLPPIEFDPDIREHGLTLAQLAQMPRQELPALIAAYNDQAPGDTLHLWMQGSSGGPIDCGTLTISSPTQRTEYAYPLATLQKYKGVGTVNFWYEVEDDVGNKSGKPDSTPLLLLIDGAPETIPAPEVPGFTDNDLVTDPDARPTLEIVIRASTPPAIAGDYFVVYVGDGTPFITPPLAAGDVGKDPVATVRFPYASLPLARYPIFTADVDYDLVRLVEGRPLPSRSEPLPVDFDLTLPGGPDPDPDPDPENPDPNDNLLAPTLVGDGGDGSENTIPPEEIGVDAIGLVPWNNVDGDPVFEADDRLQLYIDDDEVGGEHTITAAEVGDGEDLELIVPAADLAAHVGDGVFHYAIAREISGSQQVVAWSPLQAIQIRSSDELPGNGQPMRTAVFAGWVVPNIRREYALSDSSFVGGFTHVRIRLNQANVGLGDLIKWRFVAYKYDRDASPIELNPYPEANRQGQHAISADDLSTVRTDATFPHPPPRNTQPVAEQTKFVDIPIEKDTFVDIFDGAAEFFYTITNGKGESAESLMGDMVLIDMRTAATGVRRIRRP